MELIFGLCSSILMLIFLIEDTALVNSKIPIFAGILVLAAFHFWKFCLPFLIILDATYYFIGLFNGE